MSSLLVNMEPYGRLGNRLFLAAHLLAFSHRFNVPLLNLGFGEYASCFPWLNNNAAFAYPWRPTGDLEAANRLRFQYRLRELMPWTVRFYYWGDEDLDFENNAIPNLLKPLSAGREVMFRSWLFRGYETLASIRDEVIKIFRPSNEIADRAAEFIRATRIGADRLVGVHLRWADYRGTANYFDQSEFRQHLVQYQAKNANVRVRFVLFSNEAVDQYEWGGLDVARSPGMDQLFDLEAMSLCDELIGPPSTFSGWAAFVGSVPLHTLKR